MIIWRRHGSEASQALRAELRRRLACALSLRTHSMSWSAAPATQGELQSPGSGLYFRSFIFLYLSDGCSSFCRVPIPDADLPTTVEERVRADFFSFA